MAAVSVDIDHGPAPDGGRPEGAADRLLRALAAVPGPPLAALFSPLDRVRARLLRVVAPRFRELVVERDLRVAFVGTLLMISALLSTSLVPLWFIAVGPLVWGIPHIVSDVRYLVARPGYHRRPAVAVVTSAAIVAAGLGFGLRAGLAGAAAAILCARASRARRAAGFAVIAALFAMACWAGPLGDWLFVHAHNAVGVALWWAWRRRAGRWSWLPLWLFVAFTVVILAGGVDALVTRAGLHATWTGLTARGMAAQLSPSMQGPWPTRFLILYAFGQSAHYVVWMRLVPEDARPSATPRSFQQSFRALHADVGSIVLWAAVLGMIALACWAAVSIGRARDGYIQLAFFHGYLELAAAALFWAEGTLSRGRG